MEGLKLIVVFLLMSLATLGNLIAQDAKALALAEAVFHASGGESLATLRTLEFTFSVGKDGKLLMGAKHHWDLRAGTDTVAWMDRRATANVYAENTDADAQEAYRRWVNDSYWLLAPFKLRDPGTKLRHLGEQLVDGRKYEVLELSFDSVGLTPGDKYNFYIDPATHLVRRWDYMPNADKKISGTWDEYKDFNGLKLSTEHQFGDKRIYFTEIRVETE
jgi:hypothetical protein